MKIILIFILVTFHFKTIFDHLCGKPGGGGGG